MPTVPKPKKIDVAIDMVKQQIKTKQAEQKTLAEQVDALRIALRELEKIEENPNLR